MAEMTETPPRIARDPAETAMWREIAHFIALYDLAVTLRPPTREEQAAYRRARAFLARTELPIPHTLA